MCEFDNESREKLAAVHTNVKHIMDEQIEYRKQLKCHDDEIKEIRAWKNQIVGALGILGALITGIIIIIFKFLPFTR